jgi:hypothetical protein
MKPHKQNSVCVNRVVFLNRSREAAFKAAYREAVHYNDQNPSGFHIDIEGGKASNGELPTYIQVNVKHKSLAYKGTFAVGLAYPDNAYAGILANCISLAQHDAGMN